MHAPCEKDNLTTFDSNGTGKEDEGATKCSTSDPQTASTFTWSLSSDGDELTVTTSDSLTQTLKVDELSDEVLKLSFTELDSVDNVTYKYTSTYQAQ